MSTSGTAARLHILNKPPAHFRFAACLEQVAPRDSLLLLEDGVLGLTHADVQELATQVAVYVLQTDAEARGVPQLVKAGRVPGQSPQWCSMEQVVQLTEQHEQLINW